MMLGAIHSVAHCPPRIMEIDRWLTPFTDDIFFN